MRLTFHISALDRSTVAAVKRSLQAKLEGLVNASEIRNDAVANVSPHDEASIAALRSADVGIEIGTVAFSPCVYSYFLTL